MSSQSASSQRRFTTPRAWSTSSDEPTLTTMRRKDEREGAAVTGFTTRVRAASGIGNGKGTARFSE